MKKRFVALLIALGVGFSAFAGPVENMTAQCEYVMKQGACAVALDPRDFPARTIRINGVDRYFPNGAMLLASAGYVDAGLYIRLRAPVDAQNADGTYKMCSLIREFCPAGLNDGTDECKVVRSLWRASP